jgi:hypothetical protein
MNKTGINLINLIAYMEFIIVIEMIIPDYIYKK